MVEKSQLCVALLLSPYPPVTFASREMSFLVLKSTVSEVFLSQICMGT